MRRGCWRSSELRLRQMGPLDRPLPAPLPEQPQAQQQRRPTSALLLQLRKVGALGMGSPVPMLLHRALPQQATLRARPLPACRKISPDAQHGSMQDYLACQAEIAALCRTITAVPLPVGEAAAAEPSSSREARAAAGHQLWVESHKPANARELVGNPGAIANLRTWLDNW